MPGPFHKPAHFMSRVMNLMTTHLVTIAAITVVASAAVAQSEPLDLGSAARGEVLYRQICFTCHGSDLRGGIGSSLVDSYWKHGDSAEAIVKVLETGIPDSNMVSFAAMFPAGGPPGSGALPALEAGGTCGIWSGVQLSRRRKAQLMPRGAAAG